MPTYISLMSYTSKGIENIAEAPQRTQEAIKLLEKLGGKLVGLYTVMGEYDLVGIAEAPSDDVAMAFLLALGSAGNVRTTTMKAFTQDEMQKALKSLP